MTKRASKGAPPQWTLQDLEVHLQAAVDLELWTIPFYMTAMYSIKDPSDEAYQLIQSVVNEEMLHVQLASNIANAFGLQPTFTPPQYGGDAPHLDFDLDTPNPTDLFSPYSTQLGALDVERINMMSLIEYPEWDTGHKPDLRPNITEYGSIGEFYDALRVGIAELVDHIRGGQNQIDIFKNFYAEFEQQTVDSSGETGLKQINMLIDAITDQGEGKSEGDKEIPAEFQNTADSVFPEWSHFRKFSAIRDSGEFPEVYTAVASPSSKGLEAQEILVENFADFLNLLHGMFSGVPQPDFGAKMATLGGNILTCWQNGAIPKYS